MSKRKSFLINKSASVKKSNLRQVLAHPEDLPDYGLQPPTPYVTHILSLFPPRTVHVLHIYLLRTMHPASCPLCFVRVCWLLGRGSGFARWAGRLVWSHHQPRSLRAAGWRLAPLQHRSRASLIGSRPTVTGYNNGYNQTVSNTSHVRCAQNV